MQVDIPAVTGKQLIKLLRRDGWEPGRKATHGICLTKKEASGKTLLTFVPDVRASLPVGTLSAILSNKQTGLGRKGLLRLIEKYGLH